jgi:acyl carrier protein
MTIEIVDPQKLPGLTREKLNPVLEEWYNRELSIKPVFVPYHFLFGPRAFDYPKPRVVAEVPLEKITPETQKAVLEILEEKLKRPLSDAEKQPAMLLESLGLDSLDRMDLAQTIEQRFSFTSEQVATTVGELWALAQGVAEGEKAEPTEVPETWNAPRKKADEAFWRRPFWRRSPGRHWRIPARRPRWTISRAWLRMGGCSSARA